MKTKSTRRKTVPYIRLHGENNTSILNFKAFQFNNGNYKIAKYNDVFRTSLIPITRNFSGRNNTSACKLSIPSIRPALDTCSHYGPIFEPSSVSVTWAPVSKINFWS